MIIYRFSSGCCQTNQALEIRNYAGYSPLLTAAFYGSEKCITYFIYNSNINWRVQNDDGQTVFHILAKHTRGRDILAMICKQIKLKVPDDMIMKDSEGNTPLHYATDANLQEMCKQLISMANSGIKSLSLSADMIATKNDLGRTPAHIAAEKGFTGILKDFWDASKMSHVSGLFRLDDERKSCLHLAAAKGHCEVVEFLLDEVHMEVDVIADRRTTPLHLACQYGHLKVAKYLLERKASPTLRDASLYNCLEIAIINRHDSLVRELFEHPLWRHMMRNAQPIKGTKAYDTPMRKLIRYMPHIVVYVIDNKLTRTVGNPGQKVHKRTYDYEFFQDELAINQWYTQGTVLDPPSNTFSERWKQLSWSETVRCVCCCFCCSSLDRQEKSIIPYTNNSYVLVRNHPLFIVAQQSSCSALVHHPYNIQLRTEKLYLFGIYFLLLSFLLYSAYLGIFTTLVLQGKHPQYFYSLINVNYTDDLGTCERVSRALVNANQAEALKTDAHRTLRWVAFAFLYVFIVKNLILIASLFPKILRMGANYLEISVLLLSFGYIFDWYDWLGPVIFRCPVQYQIGSFAVLLAWINFLTYLRYVPFRNIGVYVVMLQAILLKFLEFLPVLMTIICGFGFSYWMLLQNQSVYKTPIEALIRTSLMIYWMLLQNQSVYKTPIEALIRTSLMMFDLGYEDRLYNEDPNNVGYYTILYFMFLITGIVFCIFVVNLMISIAVGEIPSLKDQSIVWRHKMMYNLVSDYEILRAQLRLIVNRMTCCRSHRSKQRGPRLLKFLQYRQDQSLQQDDNNVFFLVRFGRYMQKHFFDERIQDNVETFVPNSTTENKVEQ
ncbi:unnamed protein product [Adineta ricciae]|uniref:Ion transport domain-containing protein n=1 Tax=Adineta ricciae TaxID=249248 RepID=A0A815QU44_ADIRI|nr:unnamed protein product [Adineta ricciae]